MFTKFTKLNPDRMTSFSMSRPAKISDSFIGTTAQSSQRPESGYKVVG